MLFDKIVFFGEIYEFAVQKKEIKHLLLKT